MSANTPDWLVPKPIVPDWLRVAQDAQSPPARPVERLPRPTRTPEAKALLFAQFEMVFPRVLDDICKGSTLTNAIRDLPGDYAALDVGAFTRWMCKDPQRSTLYKDAKMIRTEAWTGKMVEYALGEEKTPVDLDRSKHIVDTLKWLVARENRKDYGETKTIDVTGSISIAAALGQARARVDRVVDVEAIEESVVVEQLGTGSEGDYSDEYGDED